VLLQVRAGLVRKSIGHIRQRGLQSQECNEYRPKPAESTV